MRRGALFGALVLIGAGLWVAWLGRGPLTLPTRSAEVAPSERASSGPDGGASSVQTASEATREEVEDSDARPTTLRGRVVTTEGEPLEDCLVRLSFIARRFEHCTTGADGRFEFPGPIEPGTELDISPPGDWELAQDTLELDELPREVLVFVAHLEPRARGTVHGVVIDELDGTPVPYVELDVGGEELETDGEGRFAGRELHPEGTLELHVSKWSYDRGGFDPGRDELLVIPARVGPTFFFEPSHLPAKPFARWLQAAPPADAPAIGLGGVPNLAARFEPPRLVRLPPLPRGTVAAGELVLASYVDFVCGRVELAPGRGTLGDPLRMAPVPCGFVAVNLRSNRRLEWYEDELLSLALSRRGGLESASSSAVEDGENVFVVFQPGEYELEARFDGQTVGRRGVSTGLGTVVAVELPLALPLDEEPARPAPETFAVRARITSERNHPMEGSLRLTRLVDDEEGYQRLSWAKVDGRWRAEAVCQVPAGDYRANVELHTPFFVRGPRDVHVPTREDLVFIIEDDVPLLDVALLPTAAESGEPLLAFEAEFYLDNGDCFEACDFCGPNLPQVEGHPRNVPFTWVCFARGRGAASGRYEPAESSEGSLTMPVSLPRGWGAILYVGGPNHEPLEGVQVFLDGRPRGFTGSHGRVCLAGERPSAITLRYEDWSIYDGDIHIDGSFDDAEAWMNAYLEPSRPR